MDVAVDSVDFGTLASSWIQFRLCVKKIKKIIIINKVTALPGLSSSAVFFCSHVYMYTEIPVEIGKRMREFFFFKRSFYEILLRDKILSWIRYTAENIVKMLFTHSIGRTDRGASNKRYWIVYTISYTFTHYKILYFILILYTYIYVYTGWTHFYVNVYNLYLNSVYKHAIFRYIYYGNSIEINLQLQFKYI